MKFRREQYLELMTFGAVERQMFVELFGPLVGLAAEWQSQGARPDELALVAFDWDYVPVIHCGANTGIRGGAATQIIEETEEFVVQMDPLGRKTKLFKKAATIALPLDFPVKNMDDWLRLKPLFQFHEDRIDRAALEKAQAFQKDGWLVSADIPGGFDLPRQLMGEEKACLCYYEDTELMHDIIQTLTDTAIRVLEQVTEAIVIDQVSVHEDLAGKSGPLIGPRQIEEFVRPYFSAVWDLVSSRGTRLFDMDTDGNVNSILDILIACGINSMHPFEPAAGMDVVQVRKKYGKKLVMRGGIDKHVLRRSQAEIRAELEYKMQPLMQTGGIAFGLDHRIPNGTPLENYRYYVDYGRALLGLPPRSSQDKGWQRMAF